MNDNYENGAEDFETWRNKVLKMTPAERLAIAERAKNGPKNPVKIDLSQVPKLTEAEIQKAQNQQRRRDRWKLRDEVANFEKPGATAAQKLAAAQAATTTITRGTGYKVADAETATNLTKLAAVLSREPGQIFNLGIDEAIRLVSQRLGLPEDEFKNMATEIKNRLDRLV